MPDGWSVMADDPADVTQRLIRRIPVAMYVFDVAERRPVYISRFARAALGYDARLELDPDFPVDVLHPQDAERWAAYVRSLEDLADDRTSTMEYRFRHRDGSWRWFESRDAVLDRDEDGRVRQVIGVAVDITERRDVEEALRRRVLRAGLRNQLVDAIRPLQSVEDIRAVTADLLLREFDAVAVDFADIDDAAVMAVNATHHMPDDVVDVGTHRLDSYGPLLLEKFRAGATVVVPDVAAEPILPPQARVVLQQMDVASFVLVFRLRQGRPSALMTVRHSSPHPWHPDQVTLVEETAEWAWSAVEQARAETALREREERYRALFTSIDDGFCLCELIVDADNEPVDYRFLEVNRRFEEQTGLVSPVGRTALELLPDLEAHWLQAYGDVALHGRARRFEGESPAMGRWFDVHAVPVTAGGGRQFAVVFNDITERKHAEQALQRREITERSARRRAEFLAELTGELESSPDVAEQIDRLVALLVPRIADYAAVDIATPLPLSGASHRVPGVLTSQVSLPLDVGRDVQGVLLLGLRDPSRRVFDDTDQAFVRHVADRAALSLTSALLREEEHRIALRLQQALLPDALVSCPGIHLSARYEAGSDLLEVGGDWYDTFLLADGRLCLSVGDVVSHGLEAAASMGRLRMALAALAKHAPDPGQMLTLLDEFASGPNGAAFATASCVVLDPVSGALSYSSAGHPPLLVVSRTGRARWLWDGRSRPLSGRPVPGRPYATTALVPGDVLLMFSDGLVERRGRRFAEGLDRLERSVGDHREAPLDILTDRVLADLTDDVTVADDIVVLGMRFAPSPSPRLSMVLPADPAELAGMRSAIREWADDQGMQAEVTRHLLVAVGESVGNAVEHAYLRRSTGTVELDVCRTPTALVVRVRDHGRWLPPAPGVDSRGRGTDILSALTTGFVRRTGRRGTTVHFSVPAGGEVTHD